MKISDIHCAKRLKIKFSFEDETAHIEKGDLLKIDITQKEKTFLVTSYGGQNKKENVPILCYTDENTSDYLKDLFVGENHKVFKSLFVVDGIGKNYIEIQVFLFRSITEYKTPIYIQVSASALGKIYSAKSDEQVFENTKKKKLEKLASEYIWNQLGAPALICLDYKNKQYQRENVRFVSGKHSLVCDNTPRGIIVQKENLFREHSDRLADIYIAPEIIFVEEADSAQINCDFIEQLNKISESASYFNRWEAYQKLSEQLRIEESEEFGEIGYSSCSCKINILGTTYSFETDQELDGSFEGKDVAVIPKGIEMSEDTKFPSISVGTIQKISGRKIVTYKEDADTFQQIPDKGVIMLFTSGDELIAKRRQQARDRIINKETPIKYLSSLIEVGVSGYELFSSWGSHKAITMELKRNYPKAKLLNLEQEKAVNIAINSPDIALIQGPPGTGKTTVIKAICERFREIYEAEERIKKKEDDEYVIKSPRILISSFQNEAVDNAISTPLPGDIPAYRKLAKRAKNSSQEKYQKSLDEWYANLYQVIKQSVSSEVVVDYEREKNRLTAEFISYQDTGESLEKAAVLIKHYLSFEAISYPQDLLEEAKKIIQASSYKSNEEMIDPISARLEAQRLTREDFNDDGVSKAKRLVAHIKIRNDLEIGEDVLQSIKDVCKENVSDEEFSKYVINIKELKKKFCKQEVRSEVKDKNVVNKCILAMNNCFKKQYVNQVSDIDSKKSIILTEFLSRIEQEYEELVKKYSMTTAATCQTCFDFRDREYNNIYDLVIIDEAARANPLDLFIPMSMGKKIVMVGDHKQLPHMLEPNVIQKIQEDPKFKDYPELEKSLFEKMFDMFLKGNQAKSVLLTYQYRMHPDICKFVSAAFYDNKLKTAPECESNSDFRKSPKELNNGRALTLVNIPMSYGAESERSGASKSRAYEASVLCNDVKKILKIETDSNVKIGIITFYSAQVQLINEMLILNDEEKDRVEVGTVDAFQGKEFEYVLLSCVRSNIAKGKEKLHDVGFLEKPNRLCVAFSRAKKQLAVYGDIETLIQIPCFEKLYHICAVEKGGHYREC